MTNNRSPVASNRRPVAARSSGWAQHLARMILKTPITPNQISVFSVLVTLAGAVAVMVDPAAWSYVLLAALIPVRLLCNLLDGMVAVEGGRHSALGPLYNDIPDRISDALVMIAMGMACSAPSLGWAAALFAVATAYVRLLGGALGLSQDYRGPLAKQARMWVAVMGLLAAAIELAFTGTPNAALRVALLVLLVGSAATCANRTAAIARRLGHD
ncbi:MAG: CDP-alcohol phosphatidyltransferase family protein [Thiomonas sp.]